MTSHLYLRLVYFHSYLACCCLWLAESRPHADDAALADSHYKYTEERRAVIGGLATAGLIMNGLSGILGGLFGGSKDTVDVSIKTG